MQPIHQLKILIVAAVGVDKSMPGLFFFLLPLLRPIFTPPLDLLFFAVLLKEEGNNTLWVVVLVVVLVVCSSIVTVHSQMN